MIINRVACVFIPGFGIDLYVRSDPKLAGKPLAVAENESETALIVTASEAARAEGVIDQMSAAQARACCRDLMILPRDLERELTVSNTIYKLLQKISPYVEEYAPGIFYLDISGFGLLYRTEKELAEAIDQAVKLSLYQARIGLGGNRFVAHTAACRAEPDIPLVVPAGSEKKFLAPLSVQYLPLSEANRSILGDLGIGTIGQLARISSHDLTDRLGADGSVLARLARGEDRSVFAPGSASDEFSDRATFSFGLMTAEAIVTHTEPLLSGLLARLGQFSQGCCCVTLELALEDRSTMELRLAIDRPTLSARKFLRQLRVLLSRQALTSGVIEIAVMIPAVADLAGEQGILVTSETHDLTAALPEMDWSLIPSGVTVSLPRMGVGLIPEQRVAFKPFSAREDRVVPDSLGLIPLYAVHPIGGLRFVQPAEPVEVATIERQVTGIFRRGRRLAVTRTDGPWRLTGGWWNQEYHRLYYEMETEDHSRYLLYFDRTGSRWILQGIFD
jgi:nucleotidyltransferase/DNA polymerase involved in DNA repair